MMGGLILASTAAYILGICGHHTFATDETYSIWGASKPSIGAIIAVPVLYDPGKQLFYYLVLHYFARPWGYSETAVRALSLLFALCALGLIYALGRDLIDAETGVAALAFWAFNPLAVFFAYQARGYSMFLFVGLAQMMALWRLRASATAGRTALCGVLSAALLYTHMAGLLILGGEGAMLVRDFAHGRRTPQVWIAMGIAALLFAPYVPIAMTQSRELLSGHWLDWIGTANYSAAARIAAGCVAAAFGILIMFGPQIEDRSDEPLRWLAACALLPMMALIAASVVIRPMFNLRYVTPSLAVLAILVAGSLTALSPKLRNLAACGFALGCLLMIRFDYPPAEPWPQLAEMIMAEGKPLQPIFFESGFAGRGGSQEIANGGYPFGYYAVPFDYYFHGRNPRVPLPGYDPVVARAKAEAVAGASGGGWLISWKGDDAAQELPDGRHFRITRILSRPRLNVYRIVSRQTARR